jgi:glycosyltransferase involved in cell wall biosynthesis
VKMNSNPLVSIITIFLNAEMFIQEAIDSAIAQTYDRWELLLVDDGSSDGSTQIAQLYAEQYPNQIRYLEHERHRNLGMSTSRNLGIYHAKGTYISFLDADDLWLPDKLTQQVAILESQSEATFLCSPAKWWYSWAANSADNPQDFLQKWAIPLNIVVQPPDLLLLFLQDDWASLCDLLIRRATIEKVGGYEASFRGMYEDQVFHAKLCLQFPAFVTQQCWYWYRQHPSACTALAHQAKQMREARSKFLNWLETYLLQEGFNHIEVWRTEVWRTEVWQIVQQEIWPFRHPFLFRVSVRLQMLLRAIQGSVNTGNMARIGAKETL